ncbi:MAG: hypothetical protein KGI33_09185 [Thaumarchaeota archaeon]|nr:hypothetical protein [Nitrososphaerota archaeon]
MSFSIVGSSVIGITKTANTMHNMGNMAGMTTASQNIMISFFSGFWGEVILLLSFGAMFAGMWLSGNRKILPVSVVGAMILYVSMYAYFSISLEIIGGIVMAFAFASAYSDRVARTLKLA